MTSVRLALPTRDLFVPPGEDIRLTWSIETSAVGSQTESEIEIGSGADFSEIIHSERTEGNSQAYTVPGPLVDSRGVRFIRVRVRIAGEWTDWSVPVVIEGGLAPDDWTASGITIVDDQGAFTQAPAPMIRREFELGSGVARARLYVTSLGVHQVVINGQAVSDELLNPGWTSYGKRLLASAYDVTHLLRSGSNVIGALLGDGWYRGRLGWDPDDTRGRYGRQLSLVAQLEVATIDGHSTRIVSDAEWTATTGHVRRADLYDGCLIDFREAHIGWDASGFDDTDWKPVEVVDVDMSLVRQRSAEPVTEIGSWPVDVVEYDDGCLLDGGQNISGFVRLRVSGEAGDEVVVRHAEVLDADGSLHTHSLRSAEATDRYILADSGEFDLSPEFTFHGFRYARVESRAKVVGAEFAAISSDLAPRSSFRCAHEGLNQLHDNVIWSLRDNFVAIPTDCPQRDERLGWTGDAQAFAATSATLVHSLQFWKSWLADLALDQHPELGPPAVVPDVVLDGPMRYGRAGWADAATIVPWALYESYGDVNVLSRQLASMRSWVDSLERRAAGNPLLAESPQFGDWLDPDAPGDKPWQAKVDPTFVANAFYAHSAALVARASEVLEQPDAVVERYDEIARSVRRASWDEWSKHIETTQSGCAIALELSVVPDSERVRVAQALARLVRRAGGGVSTGFLGTPLVLPALSNAGLYDEAYLMLLCRDMPSWLYQVDHGATTTWERWDAIRPDGSIHPGDMSPPPGTTDGGHMLSFNHYAYGAVIDWVYRHLGGLSPDAQDPGYRTVVIRPRPPTSIDWAETSIQTDFGETSISWSIEDQVFHAAVHLPFGTRGQFDGPVTKESETTVDGVRRDGVVELAAGSHRIQISRPSRATV